MSDNGRVQHVSSSLAIASVGSVGWVMVDLAILATSFLDFILNWIPCTISGYAKSVLKGPGTQRKCLCWGIKDAQSHQRPNAGYA